VRQYAYLSKKRRSACTKRYGTTGEYGYPDAFHADVLLHSGGLQQLEHEAELESALARQEY
jgi:hypothetical protein